MSTITDHPLRYKLANELHARPFPTLQAPCRAVFVAWRIAPSEVGQEGSAQRAHLLELLDRFGAPHPQPGATHFTCQLGRDTLKWEQHAEFVTYTVFLPQVSARAFDPSDLDVLPDDWLAAAPGRRVTSAMIRVETMPDEAEMVAQINTWFMPEAVAANYVLDRSCVVATDFRIGQSGHQNMAVFVAPGTGKRRIGRVVQRLCEIETYKSMSMLGYFRVKEIAGTLGALEADAGRLMGHLRSEDGDAAATLQRLLELSGDVERLIAETSFRFGATHAYETIVQQRITVLREERFQGRQTFSEFMTRRYDPAMRTVNHSERRLQSLAERIGRAAQLLRTKVDVSRSAQNQALLESMDRRADLALRLQETVEGLSVVAISYYAVSLAGYVAYPLAAPLGMSKGMMTAALTPVVVGLVWWMVRRIKAKMH
ncbi:DUF3422 family protein [Shimia marina]|uniref:Membrane-anchored protein n=1 Tax=Shimia marina TaxID=321267 RepID=A0A0P1FGG3_9RHOB|nr:DUF3422 domain-containing protein [Shimia marina]CUH52945.1 hypothetical protein SHM7688_02392 [Shimia marina]SFD90824.1 Uncharacterized membrane-anchored protein [Shimia marina]